VGSDDDLHQQRSDGVIAQWGEQQLLAQRMVQRWMDDSASPQIFVLAGYAGSGKTTLAKYLVDHDRWRFCSYTGKAASVMRAKGCSGATTIHSLIYRPAGTTRAEEILLLETRIYQLEKIKDPTAEQLADLTNRRAQLMMARLDNKQQYSLWLASPMAEPHVLGAVVDECSMVDARVGEDLMSFNKKILVIMDPAQLPPVGGGGFFTNRKPDILLTDVHRHGRDSGILSLATHVREGGSVLEWAEHIGNECDDVEILRVGGDTDHLRRRCMEADQILVGRNATRKLINARHRQLLGRGALPVPGDRLVCLRNDRELGLFNGAQFSVISADCDVGSKTVYLNLLGDEGQKICVSAWLHHMLNCSSELTEMGHERRDLTEMDFACALTVHKGQGSQWDNVVLFDESRTFGGADAMFARRWLYTGITRSAKHLTMVLP
jgi:Mesyanzhinovviridae Dda-like helicase